MKGLMDNLKDLMTENSKLISEVDTLSVNESMTSFYKSASISKAKVVSESSRLCERSEVKPKVISDSYQNKTKAIISKILSGNSERTFRTAQNNPVSKKSNNQVITDTSSFRKNQTVISSQIQMQQQKRPSITAKKLIDPSLVVDDSEISGVDNIIIGNSPELKNPTAFHQSLKNLVDKVKQERYNERGSVFSDEKNENKTENKSDKQKVVKIDQDQDDGDYSDDKDKNSFILKTNPV